MALSQTGKSVQTLSLYIPRSL